MLEAVEKEGNSSIVSWLPDNKSFKVHKQEAFIKIVMIRYFKQSKYRSFTRQLNVWGFERVLTGPAKGAYTHTSFVRNEPSLCHNMKRTRIKGTVIKKNNKDERACGNMSPPSCISTPTSSESSVHKPCFVIDDCLFDVDAQPDTVPSLAKEENKDTVQWFRNLGKKENELLSSQDLKYVILGMRWGDTIFAQ